MRVPLTSEKVNNQLLINLPVSQKKPRKHHRNSTRRDASERPIGSAFWGPRVSAAVFAVFVAVCAVCDAFTAACVTIGALLLLLFLMLLLVLVVLFSCVAAVWCSLCCCLCNWLPLVTFVVWAFSVVVAAAFCCFLRLLFGSPTVELHPCRFWPSKMSRTILQLMRPLWPPKMSKTFFCIPKKSILCRKKAHPDHHCHKNHTSPRSWPTSQYCSSKHQYSVAGTFQSWSSRGAQTCAISWRCNSESFQNIGTNYTQRTVSTSSGWSNVTEKERIEFDKFPNPSTFSSGRWTLGVKFGQNLVIPRALWFGSARLDRQNQWKICKPPGPFWEISFPIFTRLTRRSWTHWITYWPRMTLERKCSLKNRRRRMKTDFFEEDKSSSWSTITSRLLVQIISQRWYSGQFKQDETQRFRTIEVLHDIVHSRYSAKKRRTQIYSTERWGTQILEIENQRLKLRCEERGLIDSTSFCEKKKEMTNIAAAKENKEIALSDPQKDKDLKGSSCSFRHDENKEGKGKGRHSTRSPFRDPNRCSEEDDKDVRDKGSISIRPAGHEFFLWWLSSSWVCQIQNKGRMEHRRHMTKTKTFKESDSRGLQIQTRQQPSWKRTLISWDVFLGKHHFYVIRRMGLRTWDDLCWRKEFRSLSEIISRFCSSETSRLFSNQRTKRTIIRNYSR